MVKIVGQRNLFVKVDISVMWHEIAAQTLLYSGHDGPEVPTLGNERQFVRKLSGLPAYPITKLEQVDINKLTSKWKTNNNIINVRKCCFLFKYTKIPM